ncbi:hypothetical protein NUV25_14930 [Burkholderia pseudomultivorans]|uniref:hypothetical protein n=1 Tax=Burkholderia pseudomultivorans TaxID=1207504 RepID=UPI0028764301|nr:hypothetical protein [Burkholderia pseudomultivorans]MDS0858998.1 hypothetical protein [Burkholderia pseudomultivorans]
MSPSPLVPVEGALARPRAAPLDDVPPFGREWIFRGGSGEQRDRRCLATLSTSCIEIGAPHRACHWEPLPASARPAADASVAAAAGRRAARAGPASHQRRAMYAACWSVGALGIIGALIATHEPFGSSTPGGTIRTADAVAVRAAQSTSTGPSTSAFMATPTSGGTPPVLPAPPEPAAIAPLQHAAATSAGPSAGSPQVASDMSRSRTSPRATATPDTRRAVAASPPPPSMHRPNGVRTTIAQARPPSLLRTAARPPIARDAPHAPGRDRRSPLPHTADALDDPLTLIAIANALGADRTAPAAPAPAAGFDWTSRLSHRRLTDTPNAFAR